MQARRGARHRISSAHGIALLALVLAVGGGTVYAASEIGAGDIRKGAVRSKQIRNGAVKTADLGKRAVKRAKIAAGAVGRRQLGVLPNWQPVALSTGYATFAATNTSFGALECFRDPFGIVHLRGAVENTGSATTRVGTMPDLCWRRSPTTDTRFDEFLVTRLNAGGIGQGADPAYVDADTGEIFLENLVADNAGVALAGVALGN